MKYLLLIFILAQACACGDNKAPLPTIEGLWQAMIPAKPNWQYDFQNGLLTQYVTDFGKPLSTRQYPYAMRGDTLIIGGDEQNPPRRWLLTFKCERIIETKPLNQQLAEVLYLERVQP